MNTGMLVHVPVVHDRRGDAVGLGDRVVGLDVDHGVHGLRRHRGDHVVHVHAHFLVVAFFRPALRRDGVDEDVADRGAGLVGDLAALELRHGLADVQLLARHDPRGLADLLDLRDGDELAARVAEDERRAGVGAEVDLAADHLLHGDVARGHGELLGLDAVLLQGARAQQVVGRHAPHVGLVALADGCSARTRGRRNPGQHAGAGCREEPRRFFGGRAIMIAAFSCLLLLSA